MSKPKRYPAVTKALAHYEAALATLQETLCTVDRATLEAIDHAVSHTPSPTLPGGLLFMQEVHNAGDVFRIAKQMLDPDRALPSTAPKIATAREDGP